ncbi:RRM-containing cyclophilin regulating transcription Rct1 [Schizosaccharomyces japonicus yFS275]|uniref:Peptidyl-prolyl cis-trans isomerase n=1 Tax=Schizosaccharomyces japonicus (strain yFS275 / FY16936) TaxID=402676 RepID=B6JVQ5_SCHJY|nr:RRM-containing cyclophilin regulating transcription Rct1 [Schizosaccharomyces japonicus yFS275]EEB05456.1 RRM-containing cyclophilin regulating transcription Rct1 [Schizosaccharomyces japonicus yFS275]
MSVLLETSLGDLVIDLCINEVPTTCNNFLKLCKLKYYNFAPFYNVQKNFICQTGDPIGPTGNGGICAKGLMKTGDRFFPAEFNERLTHQARGTVSMSTATIRNSEGEEVIGCGSQFLITLGEGLHNLDERYPVFGYIAEGFETLDKINSTLCDEEGQPFMDVRIKHTIVLDDPFEDPPELVIPSRSPSPTPEQLATVRIGDTNVINEEEPEEVQKARLAEQEAQAQALTLEMVGDLPFAHVAPPENVLFVCKLNPVTQDEDLELIFSRFGKIVSCKIVRDKKTGDSLQYAFIEFDNKESVERAYFKMQNVLIDDSRIHVDFSQSVARYRYTDRRKTNERDYHRTNDQRERSPQRHSYRRTRSPPRSASSYRPSHRNRYEDDEEESRIRHSRRSYRPHRNGHDQSHSERYERRSYRR